MISCTYIDIATYDETNAELEKIEKIEEMKNIDKYNSNYRNAQSSMLLRKYSTKTWKDEINISIAKDAGLSYIWFDMNIEPFSISPDNRFGKDGKLFWSKNLAHNLISETSLSGKSFSESIDNYILDFNANFCIPQDRYYEEIGNRPELITPQTSFDSTRLTLPIPFFCSKGFESSLSLRSSCSINLCIKIRSWDKLLTLINTVTGEKIPATSEDISNIPSFSINVYANMFCRPIKHADNKQIVETFQSVIYEKVTPCLDSKFRNVVKKIYFGVQDTTNPNEWSIYDDIYDFSMTYEESTRLDKLPSSYYNFIQPYFHGNCIPRSRGMYMYSYNFDKLSFPCTQFDRLTNVAFWPNCVMNKDRKFVSIAVRRNILEYGVDSVSIY